MTDAKNLTDQQTLSLLDELEGLAKHLKSQSQYYSEDLVRRAIAALAKATNQ